MSSPTRTPSPGVRPEPRSNHVVLVGFLTGVLLFVACGSGDDAAGTTSTTQETTTTTPTEMTTTTRVQNTTTTMATTTSSAAGTTTTPIDTNSLAEGSGCTPGSNESLPDGKWFGYADEASAAEIGFDLACWFTGDAAALAAAEDGEESPPPNDYYIRNVNPTIRPVTVAEDTTVTWLPNPGDPSTEQRIPYADWTTTRDARDYQPGMWLTIQDGIAVEIQEQYVP